MEVPEWCDGEEIICDPNKIIRLAPILLQERKKRAERASVRMFVSSPQSDGEQRHIADESDRENDVGPPDVCRSDAKQGGGDCGCHHRDADDAVPEVAFDVGDEPAPQLAVC